MEKKSIFIFGSLLFLIISILFNKSFNLGVKFILSGILIIFGFLLYFILDKYSSENKIKREKELKEKLKLEEERKKKEEYERILKERKEHIEELKKEGLKKINYQNKINTTNITTSINKFQEDKIMITFFGGKLIFYSIDIVKYKFNELLYIKEFSFNTYNAIEMKENKNRICVCGYPCIKILNISITNLLGKENNSYNVIQYLNCSEYSKEITRVIELNNDSLISISTDYLLFWNKNINKNNEYEINKDKIINYSKYENLLIISNILKLDEENIVILKQSNSNLTKSSLNFIKINDVKSENKAEEIKIIDLKITPLDDNNNNLCIINENKQIFCVGCINGLGILSGENKELLQFIEFENKIKNIDLYFDNSIILFYNFENKNESGQCTYNFIQLMKDINSENNNNYKYNEIIKKSSENIEDEVKTMKSIKDGLIIIGDRKANLHIWH